MRSRDRRTKSDDLLRSFSEPVRQAAGSPAAYAVKPVADRTRPPWTAAGPRQGFTVGLQRFLLVAIVAACALVGSLSAPGTADASPPTCLDYQIGTGYGTIESEVRPYNGDPIGYYTWWWFITDLSHRPGEYEWQLFVNGSPVTKIQQQNKDDMLHFGQPRYINGKNIYNSGDVLHVDALHTAPDGTIYITPLNQCVVP